MNRKQLEAIWEETLEMPCDRKNSRLHAAIIDEAICGETEANPAGIVGRMYTLAQDCEAFANAIAKRAQAEERAARVTRQLNKALGL